MLVYSTDGTFITLNAATTTILLIIIINYLVLAIISVRQQNMDGCEDIWRISGKCNKAM